MVNKCIKEVQEALKGELSVNELKRIQKAVNAQLKALKDSGLADNALLLNEAVRKADDIKYEANARKRTRAFDLKRTNDMFNNIVQEWGDKPGLGITAQIYGEARNRESGSYSAATVFQSTAVKWHGNLLSDINALGKEHGKLYHTNALAKEIYSALWAIDLDPDKLASIDKRAVDIAKVIHKHQTAIVNQMNDAGANIGLLAGHIVRQSHNARKIKKATFDVWKADVVDMIDFDRTFGVSKELYLYNAETTDAVNEALANLHSQLREGVHIKAEPIGITSEMAVGNIAKKFQESREIHFVDGESAYRYQEKYGSKELNEAISRTINAKARAYGMLVKLGPNAAANVEGLYSQLMNHYKGNGEALASLHSSQKSIQTAMSHITGAVNVPANAMVAAIDSGVRAWNSLTMLGASTVSAFTDVPTIAYAAASKGITYKKAYSDITKVMTAVGKTAAENKMVGQSLGVAFDAWHGLMAESLSADSLPGVLNKGLNLFFRANLLTQWTDRARTATAIMEANWLAQHAGMEYGEIGQQTRNALKMYGIGDAEWRALRNAAEVAVNGTKVITPERVASFDMEIMTRYLNDTGKKVTPFSVKEARAELENKLRSYYTEAMDNAVITPTLRTRAKVFGNTMPGTPSGVIWRQIMQFKMFPIAILTQRVIPSLRDSASHADWAKNLGVFMASSIATGYLSMTAKDLAKGIVPRDPMSFKTISAAAAQGGALGIYGDFLFGETRTRHGGGFFTTLGGPSAGRINDIGELWGRVKDGDDVAAHTLKFMYRNTPGNNLFYTKWLVDYSFMNALSEWMNPGYLKRSEQRLKRENDQEYLLPRNAWK